MALELATAGGVFSDFLVIFWLEFEYQQTLCIYLCVCDCCGDFGLSGVGCWGVSS